MATGNSSPPLWLSAFIIAALLGATAAPGSGQGQSLKDETLGYAEASFDPAQPQLSRQLAEQSGHREAVWNAVRELLTPQWADLYQKILRGPVLADMARFILSYRTEFLEPSPDNSILQASVAVRVNKARLAERLRKFYLPIVGDPPKPVNLLYAIDDPVLSRPTPRFAVLYLLAEKVESLGLQVIGTTILNKVDAGFINDPAKPAMLRAEILKDLPAPVSLVVAFDPPQAKSSIGRIQILRNDSGENLAKFSQPRPKNMAWPPRVKGGKISFETDWIRPLLYQLEPVPLKGIYQIQGSTYDLVIRVKGLFSVAQEEAFESEFFKRNTAFENMKLDRLTPAMLVYQGEYSGDLQSLPYSLKGKSFGDFRIATAQLMDNTLDSTLEITLEYVPALVNAAALPFTQESRPREVQALLAGFWGRYPSLEWLDPVLVENEDNGWLTRANGLGLDTTLFGVVESRTDSDVFVLEPEEALAAMELNWFRVGRSNLLPALRIYGQGGRLLATYHPGPRINTKIKFPSPQTRVFIEVSDRFGYMEGESGGYLRFAYILRLSPIK